MKIKVFEANLKWQLHRKGTDNLWFESHLPSYNLIYEWNVLHAVLCKCRLGVLKAAAAAETWADIVRNIVKDSLVVLCSFCLVHAKIFCKGCVKVIKKIENSLQEVTRLWLELLTYIFLFRCYHCVVVWIKTLSINLTCLCFTLW